MSVPDATLIADLVRAGVEPELINRVALLMGSSADVRRTSKDESADRRRKKDAERKRLERKLLKEQREAGRAKANDVATFVPAASADSSADGGKRAPNFLSSFSSDEGLFEEGSKKVERVRARGQRMVPGAILTDEFRQAAIELGADPSHVDEMWAEHVDFWVGVPGQRGVKLDWLATWRNDVRRKLKMGNRNGQRPRQQSLSDRAFELAEQAESAERSRRFS